MSQSAPSSWQLPPGVTRGTWDYRARRPHRAEYDEYFADCKLFEHDEAMLARYFAPPGLVADFGCGTGRALLPLVRKGHRGLAIDLSQEMLDVVREKAAEETLDVRTVLANLVELDDVPDHSADYGMCLFSTLGMIRGSANRAIALRHMRRVIKPGGVFVVHVHNLWNTLRDFGGPWWLATNVWRTRRVKDWELGDKFFDYRRIPNMYLHVFRHGELCTALRDAGFTILESQPLRRGATNRCVCRVCSATSGPAVGWSPPERDVRVKTERVSSRPADRARIRAWRTTRRGESVSANNRCSRPPSICRDRLVGHAR
ncbi:MAG: class I SAM-dependent methyltransferase [Pirellulales bacterium]